MLFLSILIKPKSNSKKGGHITKKIHYYIGWFDDTMPERVAELLHGDLTNRNSIVSICTKPSEYDSNDKFVGAIIAEWLNPVGLTFDEYYLIDYRVTKERAQELLRNASVIFLHGGNPSSLNAFLAEYELPEAIKESNADVIMGASAGMMNMGMHWVSDKYLEKYSNGKFKAGIIYYGLGLDNVAVRVHYDPNDVQADPLEDELLALSQKMDVYAACNGSVIRSKNEKLQFWGDVYLISDSKIKKMEETGF